MIFDLFLDKSNKNIRKKEMMLDAPPDGVSMSNTRKLNNSASSKGKGGSSSKSKSTSFSSLSSSNKASKNKEKNKSLISGLSNIYGQEIDSSRDHENKNNYGTFGKTDRNQG